MNVNATVEIGSLVSWGPNAKLGVAMALRWAAFNGNTSLIATFSSSNLIRSFYTDYTSVLHF